MFFKKSKNKKSQTWGQPKKDEAFDFDFIGYYFKNANKSSVYQTIGDKTINDIDFYELFTYIDRTESRIGQQYLFRQLLTINEKPDFKEQERLIDYFYENEKERATAQALLSKLNKRDAYYVSHLIFDEYVRPPKWMWLIKIFSVLPIIILIFMFVGSKFFFLLVAVLIINIIIHFWNKRNIYIYIDSFSQLLSLCNVVNQFVRSNIPGTTEAVVSSLRSIEKHKKELSIFRFETRGDADLRSLVLAFLENIRIFFLLEPLMAFRVLRKLDEKRNDIRILFDYAGKIDSALSVASLQKHAPYWCQPIISTEIAELEFSEIYHPLIPNCVSNSLKINGKSILLTGSNMSGKTTFIRTVAINALLAQTINTCFAKTFILSPLRIFSAVRISDDLLSDKSYYFEEVLTVKTMIEESRSSSANLFLLDEIFRGTNTIERIAAGKAVLSYLDRPNNIVFVSTHDIELTDLLKDSYDLYHFTEMIENEEIRFDYKLKPGNLTTRNAIRILELNDYPKEITDEAKEITKLFR